MIQSFHRSWLATESLSSRARASPASRTEGSRSSSVSLRRARRTMGRESKPADVITRDYTINLGKAITGVTFKKRAPRAVAAVRASERERSRPEP